MLFTIKEETCEDLESEDKRIWSCSFSKLMHCSDTQPFLTPGDSPSPSPAVDSMQYNPLFQSPAASSGHLWLGIGHILGGHVLITQPAPDGIAATQVLVPQGRR
ncbi:hypothetical protein U9M48_037764 [Paspalum notatum var. saurae]|uniref:Uncharacterized protein n=1 Tax=Paspalum notatum var. saurae TaxID=547442 RepID=A0AAQ3XAD7_PASNO